MVTLKVSEDLARQIQDQADDRGQTIEDFLRAVVLREQTLIARQKIEGEQSWWLGLPLSERARYEGQYVAVHER